MSQELKMRKSTFTKASEEITEIENRIDGIKELLQFMLSHGMSRPNINPIYYRELEQIQILLTRHNYWLRVCAK